MSYGLPVRVGAALALLVLSACGGGDTASTAAERTKTTLRSATDGFDAEKDYGLGVHRITMNDADAGDAAYDELADIDGWLGSLNFSGSDTTLTFAPYPDQIDAARNNEDSIVDGLRRHGAVESEPYLVVIAEFTAAEGSPLDVDTHAASDAFDDLAGCDWDGSALFRDHRWYCEQALDPSVANTVRAGFAEQAGITRDGITLTLYR